MSARSTGVLSLAILLVAGAPCGADQVIDWNNIALDAIRVTPLNPPRATRALAMLHTAVFDAVNGVEGGYEPYHVNQPAPPGASPEAAAVAAAHEVLQALFPALEEELEEVYEASLDEIPDGPSKNKGKDWGRHVGRKILKLRRNDNSDLVVPYTPSGLFGHWQPTPPGFAPALPTGPTSRRLPCSAATSSGPRRRRLSTRPSTPRPTTK